jgi:hypothetical protein
MNALMNHRIGPWLPSRRQDLNLAVAIDPPIEPYVTIVEGQGRINA